MDAVRTQRYVPPHPPRTAGPVAVWRGFVGERARTAVYGWSELAFEREYMRRQVFGYTVHIPLDPDMVQRVLLDNAANYVKPDIVKKLLAPTIGSGLLSSDGALWREQRRIVAANFAPAAVDAADSRLRPRRGGGDRELADGRRSRHGGRGDGDDDADHRRHPVRRRRAPDHRGGDGAHHRGDGGRQRGAAAGAARPAADALEPRGPGRARRGQRFLRDTLGKVVDDRLPDGGADDFLGKLIRALNEKFEPEEALALAVDNAATFYLAGHETTANALTWTLFLLSEQPRAAGRRRRPRRERRWRSAKTMTSLPERLPLLRRILEESMRLYPPVPRFDRQAVGADRIGERRGRRPATSSRSGPG